MSQKMGHCKFICPKKWDIVNFKHCKFICPKKWDIVNFKHCKFICPKKWDIENLYVPFFGTYKFNMSLVIFTLLLG